MKPFLVLFLLVVNFNVLIAQIDKDHNYFIGASYGKSFSLGDFKDTDIGNPDAGFADDGNKLDIFGGYNLNDRIILIGNFRYQTFDTEIGNLVEDYNNEIPDANFSGNSGDWSVYSFSIGLAYEVKIYKKFSVYPRISLGPMLVNNPGINISSPNPMVTQNFSRSSESGFGFVYEVGLGFKTNLGKRFALMPAFAFSNGFARIADVTTITDTILVNSNYDVKIQSFNMGLSMAYKFF